MIRYLLDTDHVILLQQLHPCVTRRFRSINPSEIAITVITVEEQMQGWLDAIRQASQLTQQKQLCWAYFNLRTGVRYLNRFQMLNFDALAASQWSELRRQEIQLGAQDLRIAAIALVNKATLVTCNQADFARVPELVLEDWTKQASLDCPK